MKKKLTVNRWLSIISLLMLATFALSMVGIPKGTTLAQDTEPPSPMTQEGVLEAFQGVLTDLYDEVNPSVVNINILGQANQFALPAEEPQFFNQGLGSGFVWDEQGYIVTNNHVVEQAAAVEVVFSDGTTLPADIVGTDPNSDLAVLQVDAPQDLLEPIELGNFDEVDVGQFAIAIGNPFGLQGSMTTGIISALGRSLPAGAQFSIPDVIQTDAPINPGNSGGPLVNIDGELIGVTTAIESPVQANIGIGFAVPVSIVRQVVPVLIDEGVYSYPYLGLSGYALTSTIVEEAGLPESTRGVVIAEVVQGSPADEAGLQPSEEAISINGRQVPFGGDIITAINGDPVETMQELTSYLLANTNAGDEVTLTILRSGEQMDVDVTLGTRPSRQVPETGTPGFPGQPSAGVQLGIQGQDVSAELADQLDLPEGTEGVLVGAVATGSPAEEAGIQQGDVITTFNGQAVASISNLRQMLAEIEQGEEATITVLRDGEEMELEVSFGVSEEDEEAQPPAAPQGQGVTLGIQAQTITAGMAAELGLPENTEGVLVGSVVDGSSADEAGMLPGDVITRFNGEGITSVNDLRQQLIQAGQGEEATITVLRDGEEMELEVTFGEAQQQTEGGQEDQQPEETEQPQAQGVVLGIQARTVAPQDADRLGLPAGTRGVEVVEVRSNSPAAEAGLQPNDVITAFNNEDITSFNDLYSQLAELQAGDEATITVLRDGSEMALDVTF